MASLPIELTPQERLAISRKAIVRHMNRHHPAADQRLEKDANHIDGNATEIVSSERNMFSKLKFAARMWWHRHPASSAVELASPLLREYASAHPFKLIGISAATGVALVIARPWRMMSASALLVAAVKSSGLSNTLLTMLTSFTRTSDTTDTTL